MRNKGYWNCQENYYLFLNVSCFNRFIHINLHIMHILHKTRQTKDKGDNVTKQTTSGHKSQFFVVGIQVFESPQSKYNRIKQARNALVFPPNPGQKPVLRTDSSFATHLSPLHGLKAPENSTAHLEMLGMKVIWCIFHLHPHSEQPQTLRCAAIIPSSATPNLCWLPPAWATEQQDLILLWNTSKPDSSCQERVHIPQFLSPLAMCFVGWIISREICKYSNASARISPPLEGNLLCPKPPPQGASFLTDCLRFTN